MKNDYIEPADYNRISNNIAVVWDIYAKKGYLKNAMRDVKCDWSIDFLAMTFKGENDNGWENMRLNVWDIYNIVPYPLVFPNSPIYPSFKPISVTNPVERLTMNLLNSMELVLKNLYEYGVKFDSLPILLTENRMRQRIVRK